MESGEFWVNLTNGLFLLEICDLFSSFLGIDFAKHATLLSIIIITTGPASAGVPRLRCWALRPNIKCCRFCVVNLIARVEVGFSFLCPSSFGSSTTTFLTQKPTNAFMHFDHTHITPVLPGFLCLSWSSWLYVLIGSAVKKTVGRRYRLYACISLKSRNSKNRFSICGFIFRIDLVFASQTSGANFDLQI
jgi:hypothetical protein